MEHTTKLGNRYQSKDRDWVMVTVWLDIDPDDEGYLLGFGKSEELVAILHTYQHHQGVAYEDVLNVVKGQKVEIICCSMSERMSSKIHDMIRVECTQPHHDDPLRVSLEMNPERAHIEGISRLSVINTTCCAHAMYPIELRAVDYQTKTEKQAILLTTLGADLITLSKQIWRSSNEQ